MEIVREVVRVGYDLVVKPAEGRGGISGMLFGGTDLHLLRKWPCPVWIIKPTKRKKYARILAAVDPNPGEETNAELNRLILDLATSLAQKKRVELVVMGTVARTGIPGFIIGNTVETTLAAVDCSVLVVKPASFSTPVQA